MTQAEKVIFSALVVVCLTGYGAALAGEDESKNKMAQGALVGASTNVVGGAALDYLTSSPQPAQPQVVQVQGPDGQWYTQVVSPASAPQEDPNKTVLKRAITGAVTGAVAAHLAGGDGGNKESTTGVSSGSEGVKAEDGGAPGGVKKWPEGWRPPGWDQGEKVGWGEGDVPPGWQGGEGAGREKGHGKGKKK
ncbi:MAG: hypothetical protein HY593_04955 [Candidatus Omnitrophica bacterium]|nr:hypothetical protein [Candidatus Omnitrophota bacterium]